DGREEYGEGELSPVADRGPRGRSRTGRPCSFRPSAVILRRIVRRAPTRRRRRMAVRHGGATMSDQPEPTTAGQPIANAVPAAPTTAADGPPAPDAAPAVSVDQVKLALRRVKDPELNLNIMDLGL